MSSDDTLSAVADRVGPRRHALHIPPPRWWWWVVVWDYSRALSLGGRAGLLQGIASTSPFLERRAGRDRQRTGEEDPTWRAIQLLWVGLRSVGGSLLDLDRCVDRGRRDDDPATHIPSTHASSRWTSPPQLPPSRAVSGRAPPASAYGAVWFLTLPLLVS